MRRTQFSTSISGALLLVVGGVTLGQSAKDVCASQGIEKGWLTFEDRTRGFCFQYPPIYHREFHPGRTYRSDPLTQLVAELQSEELEHANEHDKGHASIAIWFTPAPFDLKSFVKEAPTGYVTPPDPIRIGSHTFYKYGPGGGGVAYADSYYFNLHGQSLALYFYGPYDGTSKSPIEKTKKIEEKLLKSFKTFQPERER